MAQKEDNRCCSSGITGWSLSLTPGTIPPDDDPEVVLKCQNDFLGAGGGKTTGGGAV